MLNPRREACLIWAAPGAFGGERDTCHAPLAGILSEKHPSFSDSVVLELLYILFIYLT